jgi:MFS transporter, DHA2 family, multidrug resistance protein
VPAHLPGGVLAAARTTLGGALSAAAHAPGRLGPELVTAARVAFAHGLDAAALGAAVAVLGAAVMTARYFRGVRVVPEGAADQRPQTQSELVS